MHYHYYLDNYRTQNASYDLFDLQYDNPRLFSLIFNETIDTISNIAADEKEWLYNEAEMKAINRLIIETSIELLGPSRAKVLDSELNRLKTDFIWQGITSDEKVETIFWRDCYDGFVSFVRKNNKPKMIDIFELDIDEIKNAGFSTQYITEVVNIFKEWAERLLSTEVEVGEQKEDTDNSIDSAEDVENTDRNNMVEGLMSMFFNYEEN